MFSNGVFLDQMAAAAVAQSPAFAVMLCGIGLAIMRRRRHPKASILLSSGLGLILFDYAASYTGAYSWAVDLVLPQSPSNFVAVSFVSGVVATVAFSLVIAAVFAERARTYGDLPGEPRDRGGEL